MSAVGMYRNNKIGTKREKAGFIKVGQGQGAHVWELGTSKTGTRDVNDYRKSRR